MLSLLVNVWLVALVVTCTAFALVVALQAVGRVLPGRRRQPRPLRTLGTGDAVRADAA